MLNTNISVEDRELSGTFTKFKIPLDLIVG